MFHFSAYMLYGRTTLHTCTCDYVMKRFLRLNTIKGKEQLAIIIAFRTSLLRFQVLGTARIV